ncbi:DUF3052 family protein [Nocardiopsis coralliicola]
MDLPSDNPARAVEPLGIEPGQTVQEAGGGGDVDHGLREAVEARSGSELVDADDGSITDVALLWFRQDDGDLADALIDAIVSVGGSGTVWLLIPGAEDEGHVPPEDVAGAVRDAGLVQTASSSASAAWSGYGLTASPAFR